jgi:hypothetical protein
MSQVYVKLEKSGVRGCFIVETSRNAHEFDHETLRQFVRDGVKVTCIRKEGASKEGWDAAAES